MVAGLHQSTYFLEHPADETFHVLGLNKSKVKFNPPQSRATKGKATMEQEDNTSSTSDHNGEQFMSSTMNFDHQ